MVSEDSVWSRRPGFKYQLWTCIKPVSYTHLFKLLVKNKYYMMICGTYILQQLYSAMIGAGIYYCTWVLKNKNLFGVFAWAVNIPLIIALIFTPTLVGKWKRCV